MRTDKKIATAILAGGKASRMGCSKLTLPFSNTTLLDLAIDAALGCEADETIVVTGANRVETGAIIERRNVKGIFNPKWEEGQSTSVKTAAQYAKNNGFDALIIMVGDQPYLESAHLTALIHAFEQKKAPIIASRCDTRMGNPCLFSSDCFDLLLNLTGDEGARALLKSGKIPVETVHFFDSLFLDVDTPEEFEKAALMFASQAEGR